MGYIKHNAVIVTHWKKEYIIAANKKAAEIMSSFWPTKGTGLVSPILEGVINGQYSFLIAPDGSKEGWADSGYGDEDREQFLNWLKGCKNYVDYIEVQFGGDDEHESILRSKHSDLEKEENI